MKNKRFRLFLLYAITIGIIVAFGYYLYLNADKYLKLLHVSAMGVVMLFLLSLVLPILNGMQNVLLYRSMDVVISHQEGFLLSATSSLANQLPLPGGVVSKGFYLKRKYNLSYIRYASSTLALFFCYIALDGFVGVAIIAYWFFFEKVVISPLLLIGFSLMSVCLLVFWLPLERIKLPERFRKRVNQAVEGWMVISKNPSMLLKILFLQGIMILLLAIRYWLAFRMLSQNVTMGQVLLLSNASILTQMVSIAPGGLGVREALVGGVASALGFDMGVSVVAVGLDRLVSTFVKLLIGGISTVILGSQITKVSVNEEDE